jgi:hypothetical protein
VRQSAAALVRNRALATVPAVPVVDFGKPEKVCTAPLLVLAGELSVTVATAVPPAFIS